MGDEERPKDVDHHDEGDIEQAVLEAGHLCQNLFILGRVGQGGQTVQAESVKCNHRQRHHKEEKRQRHAAVKEILQEGRGCME